MIDVSAISSAVAALKAAKDPGSLGHRTRWYAFRPFPVRGKKGFFLRLALLRRYALRSLALGARLGCRVQQAMQELVAALRRLLLAALVDWIAHRTYYHAQDY